MTDERLNIRIKICCDAMDEVVMMNDIREGITTINDKLYIWWKDGDCMPLNYCPSCGKKIEVLNDVEAPARPSTGIYDTAREIVKEEEERLRKEGKWF